MRPLLSLIMLLLVACGATVEAPMPETLPTPYSAAAIQAAMPPGTEVLFRIESSGKPTVLSRWSVLGNEDAGLRMESSTLSEDGATVLSGPEAAGPTPWEELESHARFPAAETTRVRGEVTVPFGTFNTWRYTRTTGEAGATSVTEYHFADGVPGPPVLMTVDVDGARTMTMTMTGRTGVAGSSR